MVDDAEMDDEIEYIALYHDDHDGEEQECNLRYTVDMLLSSPTAEEMKADPNVLVVIPASNDFLGIFQGDVELTVTFKPFGECTVDDAGRVMNAHVNHGALLSVEGELLAQLGDAPEDDRNLPPRDLEKRIQAFRAGVREAVEEQIARKLEEIGGD